MGESERFEGASSEGGESLERPTSTGESADETLRGDASDVRRLDRKILELLNERADAFRRLVSQRAEVGHAKLESGIVDDVERPWQALHELVGGNSGPLSSQTVRSIFRELISGSLELVRPVRVSYLGPPYSYSHLAAIERFGESAELAAAPTIRAVFEALQRSEADYGLVPVENSTDGRIVDTLNMFARRPVSVCGEVQLRIHHCLLGKCARGEIRQVCSKPQALSQCRDWLSRRLAGVDLLETASTAVAAERASQTEGVAAIASRQAGAHYGLQVIDANIEDNPHNVTRFAVLGGDRPPPSGADKTTLMLELPHQPGALADAMAVFKASGLNMTWIESFPRPDTPSEYLFFIELEGHRADSRVKDALTALEEKTARLEILGSYSRCDPIG